MKLNFETKIQTMNKRFVRLSVVALGLLAFASCKNKDKKTVLSADSTAAAAPSAASTSVPAGQVGNQPLNYNVTATPDSAVLGKKNEALVKITGGNAVALQDADGKATGMEVTLKLSVTNKSKVGNAIYFSVNYTDARLQLDNNNSVAPSNGSGKTSPEPEATTEAEWTFTLPANTKPKKLSLFLDGTRVAVDLNTQEKK